MKIASTVPKYAATYAYNGSNTPSAKSATPVADDTETVTFGVFGRKGGPSLEGVDPDFIAALKRVEKQAGDYPSILALSAPLRFEALLFQARKEGYSDTLRDNPEAMGEMMRNLNFSAFTKQDLNQILDNAIGSMKRNPIVVDEQRHHALINIYENIKAFFNTPVPSIDITA